jgi:hypothetical protein
MAEVDLRDHDVEASAAELAPDELKSITAPDSQHFP